MDGLGLLSQKGGHRMNTEISRRDLLPAHGTLSPEALYGFRVACACFETWGRQLANSTPEVSLHGKFMTASAIALRNTIGQGQIPPAAASLIPDGFTG